MNKPIRILFTISNFHSAGSGKVLYDLAKGLDKNKFEISIACGDNKGLFFNTIESLGLPIYIFETKTPYKPYYNLLFRILKISKFYRKHQFDIVHSWQWSNDWTEALAARFAGIKWLYTKKAMGFKSKHWKIKSYLAHFIITINDEMYRYFPNKKAQQLIPLGIDLDYYSPNHFKVNNSGKFKVITVANLVPVKGVEVLIKAINHLNDSSVTLTIVGDYDNPYGRELIKLVNNLNLQSNVKFIGKVPDVRPYISQADLFVIPTLDEGRKEGMPMALVEAMSLSKPTIGSDVSGIKYVLKEFPELLFKPSDDIALANKIKYVKNLTSVKRNLLGVRLREYCLENFTINSFIKSHESLYQQLLLKVREKF